MGLLDDAIREHLELKRAHGASDEEIAQKEAEALGPARRDFPRQVVESEEADDVSATPDEPDALEEPLLEEPPEFGPPALEPEPSEQPPTEEYVIEEDEEEPSPHGDEPFLEEVEPPAERQPKKHRDEDEDVLEDTPDFLQESPEHDRLWFEQKPPRDFDFE